MLLLNGSGCLDALTAPDVARALDAFVTKTITPLPREGNAPVRIAETEHGMLNAIGLANPGRDAFLEDVLPRLRELGVPLWVSVGGFAADEYAETCAALADVTIELNLSCPNVDEARGVGRRDRRGVPCSHRPAAVREALAGDVGRRRDRAGGRSCRSRRALAREHDPRPRARRADAAADARTRSRAATRAPRSSRSRSRRSTRVRARRRCRSSGWAESAPDSTRSS